MKTIICTKYGSAQVLTLTDTTKPKVGKNDILIKTVANVVTAADSMMRRGDPAYARLFLGLSKPRQAVPGTGFSGIVSDVGTDVKTFKPRDRVFGETGTNFGAHAEFILMSDNGVISKIPKGIDFEDAATITDGPLTVLSFFRMFTNLKPGQKIMIIGASGSLGTAAVQMASAFGAEVTGVCSGKNANLIKSLGAERVIDYEIADFSQFSQKFDVVFDTVGKSTFGECKPIIASDGVYMSPVLGLSLLISMLWTSVFGAKRAKFSATGIRSASELMPLVDEITEMMTSGVLKPVIDRSYPFEQYVEANTYVDTMHKKGNVLLVHDKADSLDLVA